MKISDDLRKALEKAKNDPTDGGFYAADVTRRAIIAAIPRIEALERCRELLEKHHGGLLCGISVYETPCTPNDCEIAKALEATP